LQGNADQAAARVHPTAIVSGSARLHETVQVGPGAIIEDNVEIGAGSRIGPYAVIREFTRMGENNSIDAHAVIGGLPQHSAFDGSETWLSIGDSNVLREFVTINRGFEPGGVTRIGSGCFFMTGCHVGHDCVVGDNVVMTNHANLAGHVEVGRNVIMGGVSGAHQFTRIGPYTMVAPFAVLKKDALPYTLIGGTPVRHYRLNKVGLKRNGITGDRYRALEKAFRALRSGNRALEGVPDTEETRYLREWLSVKTKYGTYGFLRPGGKRTE